MARRLGIISSAILNAERLKAENVRGVEARRYPQISKLRYSIKRGCFTTSTLPDGATLVTNYRGRSFIVDASDWDAISDQRFSVSKTIGIRIDDREVALARYLLDAPNGLFVDHIDGNPLNNRRSNLRICSPAENSRNAKIPANNATGFKGVNKLRAIKRPYKATIGIGRNRIVLGTYSTAEEAARAYDAAAREYHGAFACLNFPEIGEQSVHRAAVNKSILENCCNATAGSVSIRDGRAL